MFARAVLRPSRPLGGAALYDQSSACWQHTVTLLAIVPLTVDGAQQKSRAVLCVADRE